ncbi:MAG: nuclear transport factor 2 family protein [Pseudomonadota bacterium]
MARVPAAPPPMGAPEAAYRAMMACYARGDIAGTLKRLAPDAVLRSNVDGLSFPEGASAVGHEQIRLRFEEMFANFDLQRFETDQLRVDGALVHTRVQAKLKHYQTGEELEGTVWFACEHRDGVFVRVDEYIDIVYFHAYLRLIGRDAPRAGDDQHRVM